MKNSNVAVTDDPFRLLLKNFKIKFINDPQGAVSPARADDRPDGSIIQHLLHILRTLFITSGILILASEQIFSKYNFQSPLLECVCSKLNFFLRNFPSWSCDSDLVAFL